jgi:hypothetical protein
MGMTTQPSTSPSLSPARRTLRHVGAVVAGLLANVVLGVGTDLVLHATSVFPPFGQPMGEGLFLLALTYRTAYGVLGCWLAARLAPDRPLRAAWVLGVLGFAIGTTGALATWDAGPEFGPKWYAVAVAVIALPCAWLGGRLEGRTQTRTRGSIRAPASLGTLDVGQTT